MLSIDEAIAHARENYNDIINTTYNKCQYEHLSCEGCATPTCKEIADENLQVAEWLEELKSIKSDGFTDDLLNIGYTKGYNKAIDDFINACKEDILCQTFGLHIKGIERIAEQLKAGVKE